jgi:hypothetical protein
MSDSRWIKSEKAGYAAGAILLDMPAGMAGHWSVRKGRGRRWVAALVKNGVAEWSKEFMSRREAMECAEADVTALTHPE